MAYYAFLDENNIVTEVISGIDENTDGRNLEEEYGNFRGQTCKRTSFNTRFGKHWIDDPENPGEKLLNPDQSKSFRGNFAGVGYKYHADIDMFVEPVVDESYESWVLNTLKGIYEPPIEYPDDGLSYTWEEETQNWVVQP